MRAIRLDSGDLLKLSLDSRKILNDADLQRVGVFASGELDEFRIDELLEKGAPIDGFGVGTRMGTSADAPFIDSAYKLVSYAGKPRMKFSTGKMTLPGRKQVFRLTQDGYASHDVIALQEEAHAGIPLMGQVMKSGKRLPDTSPDLVSVRNHCREETTSLPKHLRELEQTGKPYPVELSPGIKAEQARLAAEYGH